MPGGIRVHLYCVCWNDAQLLPFFFRHYDEIADDFFVYDLGSDVATLAELRDRDRVHVEHVDFPMGTPREELRRLNDRIWQRSRGKADWVILVDADEHLFRPNLVRYLKRCAIDGVTAIRAIEYEMVGEGLPSDASHRLSDVFVRGRRCFDYSRLCIFNPDAVSATHFSLDRRRAWPEGQVVWPPSDEVLLLRFTELGAADARGLWRRDGVTQTSTRLRGEVVPVPGLGALSDVAPEDYRGDEKIIEQSGLLDAEWYLANHRDLAGGHVDPLAHYCNEGWRDARQPNFYFDPIWYQSMYPDAGRGGANPLIHYALRGEAQDDQPSPHFDTAWYRESHGLAAQESPLRHYLLRRSSGRVSPVPRFDAEAYCREHPEVLAAGRDPYEDFVGRGLAAMGMPPEQPYPTFQAVFGVLGLDAGTEASPATVPWRSLTDVIRLFLRRYPFDESWYLRNYPDVDAAVRSGEIPSALDHFIEYGFFEGRRFGPK